MLSIPITCPNKITLGHICTRLLSNCTFLREVFCLSTVMTTSSYQGSVVLRFCHPSFSILLLRAVAGIVSCIFTLVAYHMADVFLVGVVGEVLELLLWTLISIVSLVPTFETGDLTKVSQWILIATISSFVISFIFPLKTVP